MLAEDEIRTEELDRDTLADHVYDLFSSSSRRSANAASLGFVNSASDCVSFSHDRSGTQVDLRQSPAILNSAASSTTGAVLWKVTPIFASWVLDSVGGEEGKKKSGKAGKTAKSRKFSQDDASVHTSTLQCIKVFFGPGNQSKVLELGCGATGMLACVLAPLVKSYVATDQPHLLKIAKQNMQDNLSLYGSSSVPGPAAKPKYNLECMELDWEEPEESWQDILDLWDGEYPDVVLACDTIYNEYLIPAFVATLKLVSGPDTVILVAQQLRLSDIFETFITELLDADLRVFAVPENLLRKDFAQGYTLHMVCQGAESGSIE